MSVKTDVLVQLTLKEDDDKRRRTWSLSDKTVSESVWHYLDLATDASTYTIPLGGIGTDTGAKIFYLETDQTVDLFMTTNVTQGLSIEANGFYCAYINQTISPQLEPAASASANIQVAIFEV